MIDTPTPLTDVTTILVEVLKPLALAAGAAFAGWAANWIRRKTKVDVSKTLSTIVELAIGYAEQMARKKGGTGHLTSEEKLEAAKTFAREQCGRLRLPSWACTELEKQIEAHLGLAHRQPIAAVLQPTPPPAPLPEARVVQR